MNRSYRRIVTAAMLLISLCAIAQEREEMDIFMESAGLESQIFRGRQAPEYYFRYNGTPYWTSPAYLPGKLSYDGKIYEGLEINIDAAAQKMLCIRPGFAAKGMLEGDFVEWAEFGGRKYIGSRANGYETLPEGFFEVLYDAGKAKILKQVKKTLKTDKDGNLRSQTGYKGPLLANVNEIFVISADYYHISPDGTAVQLKRGKDIVKLYPERKKELNRHMRQLQSGGLLDIEKYLVAAIRFAEGQ